MKKIDFINYISLFKEIKIKIEKFCNKIYTEFIEKNIINNNDIKIKFENIKDTFLNEIKTNIDKLININNYDGNDIQKNYKEVKKNEIQNEIKQIKNNNDNKNTKQIDEQLNLKILQEIKNNLSNNNKLEFHPPEIEQNHISYLNDLNDGLMEDESNYSENENFDFLRFDKEIYINESKGQILDDLDENIEIIELFKNPFNNKENYLKKNKENEEEKTNEEENEIIDNYNNQINKNSIIINKTSNEIEDKKNQIKITVHQENKIEDRWPYKIENIYKIYYMGNYIKKVFNQINLLTWEERGLIEFLLFPQNSNFIYVYNVFLENKEKINIDFYTPFNFSYLNIPPYVYLSGGLNLQYKELSLIYRFRRYDKNNISYEKYSKLNIPRCSHSSIYIQFSDSIIFISGIHTTSCEELNVKTKVVKKICDLNCKRESCSPCLINDTDLYVFFGLNSDKNEYFSSIEKMDLRKKNKWELINIKINSSDMNIYEKQNSCCIPHKLNNKEGILLIGGASFNYKISNDIYFYFIDSKSLTSINTKLPYATYFTNQMFIEYGMENSDYLFNVSENGILIKFIKESGEFKYLIK